MKKNKGTQIFSASCSAIALTSVVMLASTATCVGQIIIRPVIVAQPAPVIVQQPVYVQQPVVVQQPVMVAPEGEVVAYTPAPFDIYLTNVAPADVVVFGGNTYVWVVDEHGHRERRFYARGDHRDEVFHRHDELRRVAERNGGHLPAHGESREEAMAHEQQRMAQQGHPGGAPGAPHGPMPAMANHAAGAPAPAAAHPAAAHAPAPASKEKK